MNHTERTEPEMTNPLLRGIAYGLAIEAAVALVLVTVWMVTR